MEIDKINNFWLFFKTVASEILNNPEDLKLITCIDNEVSKLGEISWEYGPANDGFYFCLSPNFRFGLIPYTEFAISLAPSLLNWKFVSGKPQKLDCIEEFVFINDDGKKIFLVLKIGMRFYTNLRMVRMISILFWTQILMKKQII